MRNIGAENLTSISATRVDPILLAQFDFDSGTIGMWTGIGTFDYEGIQYQGGGTLIGISPIQETQELVAKGLVVSLNGISSSLIATALTENIKNRPMRIYLALLAQGEILDPDTGFPILNPETGLPILNPDIGFTFVDEPYRIFSGLMDTFEISDDSSRADIRLSVESILLIGQRSKISRYTDEEQRKRFPNDRGLEFINRLQDREIVW